MKKFLVAICPLIPVMLQAQAAFRFLENPSQGAASCTAYTVIDSRNKQVQLSGEIQDFLACPPFLSIHNTTLTYLYGDTMKNYNLISGETQLLFIMPDSADGVSGPAWSADGKKMMFVIINQEKRHGYTEACRIVHLDLHPDGTVKRKLKYDRPVNFSCGSICTAEPGKDFMYLKKGRIIRYKIHEATGSRTAYGQVALPE